GAVRRGVPQASALAEPDGTLWAAAGVGAHALAQPGDRGRRCGFGEDTLAPGKEAVRLQDLVVADRVDGAARFISRGDGAFPRRGISHADRGRDRLRPCDGLSADERRRSLRLVAVHARTP